MTDSSMQEQRSQTERRMQQKKWERFANNLRHSTDANEHGVERAYDDNVTDSLNGLKSPISSDEQQSDLGTDLAIDEKSSNGIAEDGFELVINKRRNQNKKPVNGSVWTGAATHLKELHSSSASSANTAPHSGSSSTQSSTKLRVTSAATTTSSKSNPASKTLTSKASPYGLIRCMEEGVAENEQDMSNSSDSAFAENQSPSHGSSTSLHFMSAFENHNNFSDSVALSDDEKWPELGVVTKNDQATKSTTELSSPKLVEVKSTTPVDEKSNPLEKKKAQWKKVDIDISYGKPNEKKNGSSKKSNFRSDTDPKRQPINAPQKKRPQSRKSNVSSSDVEVQNNNEVAKPEVQFKPEESVKVEHENLNNHHQSTQSESYQQQPYARQNNQNIKQHDNRSFRNNGNNFRSEQQYNDYSKRQIRNQKPARHSVPNLLQCQPTVPIYFLGNEYSAENYIQPLGSAPASNIQPFIYPGMNNVYVPTTFADMTYANAQFMNDYAQQSILQQYRAPFIQIPMMPQTSPYINTNLPTTISEAQVSEPSPADQNSTVGQSLEEELSQLLRKVFMDASDKTLRNLTDDQNIISHLNYSERCLILRCQMSFYFSAENLAKDIFLRSHMQDGFVPLGLFTTFPRIKNLSLDHNAIVTSLLNCENFELKINEQEVKIRAKSLPQLFSPPGNQSTPPNTVQSPSQSESNKRLSQVDVDDISVDDVRARLMSRSKHSPSSIDSPHETIHELPTDLPSDLPSEILSELPIELPTELPTYPTINAVNSTSSVPTSNTVQTSVPTNAPAQASVPTSAPVQTHKTEDEWVLCKKKSKQPISNGSVNSQEPNSKSNSKHQTGKSQSSRNARH